MEEQLYSLLGKLYVEALNSQKVIELLQNKLEEKEKTIQELQGKKSQEVLND
jgi:hypothetical protein|tara:strand:+ start:299 stop:454 length:156 start_codon:yes stop_codon:yes gene_type:complete